MNHPTFALLGLLAATSCTKADDEAVKPLTEIAVPAKVAEAITLSARSQFDLAAEIRVIEQKHDDDERAFSFANLSDAWQGERYEWTVNFLSSFCPNENGCHVVPFDRGGKDKTIVQGWSPELKLSAAQWERVSSACAATEGPCRLTFEGTLSQFRISTEELTRLTFSDVSVIAVGDEVTL
jgi:hypothetical protein